MQVMVAFCEPRRVRPAGTDTPRSCSGAGGHAEVSVQLLLVEQDLVGVELRHRGTSFLSRRVRTHGGMHISRVVFRVPAVAIAPAAGSDTAEERRAGAIETARSGATSSSAVDGEFRADQRTATPWGT